MCQALMEIMKDEIEEREEKASIATKLDDVKNLMETLHLSLDQALDALKVSPENRTIIIAKLQ